MAKEIERTFLVKNEDYKDMCINKIHIIQGYLNRDPHRTVRVRITDDDAFLTIKGKTVGFEREEFEYKIPKREGEALMKLCDGRILDKTRYLVPYENHIWEIDEYHGDLEGLVVTEVELERCDEPVKLAPFAGEEVSGDPKYFNSNL
ncbi:MAG: CYTH domain-containing protein [Muribaculaceae bacterium]|nr:CYTH domain-containing protein [Muribaculaceae bacterium]